jgi:transposase
MRYELTDCEWAAIKPFLPNKPRGVPGVNDRRVDNGIFWVLRSGTPWRDLSKTSVHTPPATIASSAGGGRASGQDLRALAGAHDAAVQMIDTSIVRMHQHGACITRNRRQYALRQTRGPSLYPARSIRLWLALMSSRPSKAVFRPTLNGLSRMAAIG